MYNVGMSSDLGIVVAWWGTLFLVGTIAYPFTKCLFRDWFDRGYLFAKVVGMALVTYIVYLAAMFHILPFTRLSVGASLVITFGIGLLLTYRNHTLRFPSVSAGAATTRGKTVMIRNVLVIALEELLFFGLLLLWSWVKGHEPTIHGLEKFMDYGFTQSMLNSRYFPASDMWYAGLPINYYYFGHTVLAVLTKLSNINLAYTFNLMLATLFALCFSMAFSIAFQILGAIEKIGMKLRIFGATLTAYVLTLGGNLQTVYAFTQGYIGEDVVPFWTIFWPIAQFWQKFPEGAARYWYANATRFIPYTIHEFPSYSFAVSDIHGHVLSIPFALLAIALLIALFAKLPVTGRKSSDSVNVGGWGLKVFSYGLLVSILLMTNALDGPIYGGLFFVVFLIWAAHVFRPWKRHWKQILTPIIFVGGVAIVASIPFLYYFTSFVSGVAVNCPLVPLANSKIGPIIFEGVEKCQHSPIWMMAILWGFFIYCGAWFILTRNKKFTQIERILTVFFFFSLALIIFPEFFYFKDIYPMHFRSNTMFKLGYQAFMLFSFVSGYSIVVFLHSGKRFTRIVFFTFLTPLLFLVIIYPYFSVRSYFGELKTYQGLYGLSWLANQYPDDYVALQWLQSQFQLSQSSSPPVIVEADGDSYTDYARISAFTGFPAVVGWPVHEWLWRGSYDVVAPRREEVRTIYESDDIEKTREILAKYNVRYIVVGALERQKYQSLRENKLKMLGSWVFFHGQTNIYLVK
jgi:uncharacterized membrane protein